MSTYRDDAHSDQASDEDPILAPLMTTARNDPETMGLILTGSRGAGVGDDESDYDLIWVLSDAAYERRQKCADPLDFFSYADGRRTVDGHYSCPRELAHVATNPGWWTAGYATSRLLLDKTGDVTRALQAIATMPEETGRTEVETAYDGYLNCFYRSLKAARRGNELGARLQAAESLTCLARTLFALERRWPPYHDRLLSQLDTLKGQGWAPGELHERFLEILRTADPELQKELEITVEALMAARGFAHVVEAWDGEIERARAAQRSTTDQAGFGVEGNTEL